MDREIPARRRQGLVALRAGNGASAGWANTGSDSRAWDSIGRSLSWVIGLFYHLRRQ
jgi:hypothetical protein